MSAVLKYLGGAAATQHPDCHCGHSMSFQSVVYPGRTLAFAERPAAAVSGHLGNLNFYLLSEALCIGQNLTLGIFFFIFLTQGLSLIPELTDSTRLALVSSPELKSQVHSSMSGF